MFIRARNEKHTTRSMECSRKKTRKINYVWISVRTRYLESQPSLSLSLFKDQKYRARWRAMESAKRATLAKAVSYQFSSPFYFSLSVFLSLSLPLSHFKRSDCFHLAWSGQWRAVLADYSAILFFRCHGGPGGGRIVFVRCLFPFFQISFSLFLSLSLSLYFIALENGCGLGSLQGLVAKENASFLHLGCRRSRRKKANKSRI